MNIFAISDLHLGFSVDKPMDIFGDLWKNHADKIHSRWLSTVKKDDIVLVPGDISWAMNYSQAMPDLVFLDSLPGTKYICRGNHDYWWSSAGKTQRNVGRSINVLQRNAVDCGQFVLAASKGWNTPLWEGYKVSEDQYHYEKELSRMKLTLKKALALKRPRQKLVYMMHYPPVFEGKPSMFAEILADSGVDLCVYGHLHENWGDQVNMNYRNVVFRIVSSDYLDFTPLEITAEVFR